MLMEKVLEQLQRVSKGEAEPTEAEAERAVTSSWSGWAGSAMSGLGQVGASLLKKKKKPAESCAQPEAQPNMAAGSGKTDAAARQVSVPRLTLCSTLVGAALT